MAAQIKTRIIHKHDLEINWDKADNFIPKQGEIIIYDKDSKYNYERVKIGDGSTPVKSLPFIDESLKAELQSQIDTLDEDKMDKTDYLGPVIKTGTFVDYDNGAEGLSISPTTYFSPIQSGSGDPYPAGSGKNLCGDTLVQGTRGTTGVLYVGTSYTAITINNLVPVTQGMTIYINSSHREFVNGFRYYLYDAEKNLVSTANVTAHNAGVSIPAGVSYFAFQYSGQTYADYIGAYAMVSNGEFLEYVPYDNIRPITGWTNAKLTRCGKNLIYTGRSSATSTNGITFTPNADGSITVTGEKEAYAGFTGVNISAHSFRGKTFTITAPDPNYVRVGLKVFNTANEIVWIDAIPADIRNGGYTFIMPEDAETFAYNCYANRSAYSTPFTFYPQLEIGSAATEYEPYQGETFTTQFGQTVYGGELNWNTGILTVDKGYLTLDGSESWGNLGNRFAIRLNGYEVGTHYVIADRFKTAETWLAHMESTNTIILYRDATWGDETRISIITDYNSVDEWKAYLAAQSAAGTPVQICYKLAAPYTIQLSPKQIDSLQGYNALYGEGNELKVIFNTINQSNSLESLSGVMPIDKGGTGASSAVGAATNLITGAASTIASTNLTANKVLISNDSGKVVASTISKADLETLPNKVDKETGKGLSTHDFDSSAKSKLDGIANGAEVNQNAFSNVIVGSTTVSAASKTDNLTFTAGANITLTPDATNKKITITAKDTQLALDTNLDSSGKAADSKAVGDRFTTVESNLTDLSTDVTNLSTDVTKLKKVIDVTAADPNNETLDRISEIVAYTQNNKGLIDSITTSKQDKITGAASTVTNSNLTVSRALISDSNGKIAASAVTSTELGYLDGVSSSIQQQLDDRLKTSDLQVSVTGTGSAVTDISYDSSKKTITLTKGYSLPSAGSSLGGVKTGGDVSIASGVITVNQASKVKNNLVVKFNGGSTEGTNLFTFNGSSAKTINVTPDVIGAMAIGCVIDGGTWS